MGRRECLEAFLCAWALYMTCPCCPKLVASGASGEVLNEAAVNKLHLELAFPSAAYS